MASSGFDNTFKFLIDHTASAEFGFSEKGDSLGSTGCRPWASPPGEVQSFTEEDLLTIFDRSDMENTYAEAVAAKDTTNMHIGMIIPSLKSDYVAGIHRDVALRRTNRIARIIAETSRRVNHSANVHNRRKEGMGKFETLRPRDISGGSA